MNLPAASSNEQFRAGVLAYENGLYDLAARIWSGIAKTEGEPVTQYNLGLLYEQGRGVTPDPRKAAHWYRKAAKQGYAPAQFRLGALFLRGTGVPENRTKAMRWWRAAAKQGNNEARSALGALLRDGSPADLQEGNTLLAQAGACGDAALAAVPAARPYGALRDPAWIRAQEPEHITLQLSIVPTEDVARDFLRLHGIERVATFYEYSDGYRIVGGSFPDRETALSAIGRITAELRACRPRMRCFADVQRELSEHPQGSGDRE